jgi:NAD-dependent dihydropyrimidine dehydrogenase PreA subunit
MMPFFYTSCIYILLMGILINHKLCDEAPACGGIEVCPVGAFFYDKKTNKVRVDENKCIKCLQCTLPGICPANCIYYARNKVEENKFEKLFDQDGRSPDWLWRERYGVSAGKIAPFAKVLSYTNFKKVINKTSFKLIDVWHEDFMECRLFSPLFSDLVGDAIVKVLIYKLNARRFPNLTQNLNVFKFPTLLLLKNNIEVWRHEGIISSNFLKYLKRITVD